MQLKGLCFDSYIRLVAPVHQTSYVHIVWLHLGYEEQCVHLIFGRTVLVCRIWNYSSTMEYQCCLKKKWIKLEANLFQSALKHVTNGNVVEHQAYRNPRNHVRALVGLVSNTSARQVHTLSKLCSAGLFLLRAVQVSSLCTAASKSYYTAQVINRCGFHSHKIPFN